MSDWLKKLIEKIKNSDLYKKIEKKLQEVAPATQNIPTKQKVMLGISLLLILDMSIYLVSSIAKMNAKETELQKISKNLEEVEYFESNTSALGALLAADKVYFIVDDALNVDVIFQEGNQSKEIKNLPIYSITRSIEKELIKANINYQWLKKEEPIKNAIVLPATILKELKAIKDKQQREQERLRYIEEMKNQRLREYEKKYNCEIIIEEPQPKIPGIQELEQQLQDENIPLEKRIKIRHELSKLKGEV